MTTRLVFPVRIYHNRPLVPAAWSRSYDPATARLEAVFATRLAILADPAREALAAVLDRACESAYRICSSELGRLTVDEEAAAAAYRDSRLRRLTVGDVVAFSLPSGTVAWFACELIGFRAIDRPVGQVVRPGSPPTARPSTRTRRP